MSAPVSYKLVSLEFRNRLPANQRRLGFSRALILHHPASRTAIVDRVDTPANVQARMLATLMPYELESIRYFICAPGYVPFPYCHPFPRGSAVFLHQFINPSAEEKNQLYLQQRDGKRFFSDNFTLASVTNDTIPSRERVFQFHE